MERLQLDPLRRGRLQPDAKIDRPPDQGLHLRRQDLRSHVQAAVDPDARQIGEPELEVGLKAREVLRLEREPPAPVGERPLAAEIEMQLAGLRALRDSREQATRLVRLQAEIERSAREIGIERKPCVRRRLIDTVDAEGRGEPVRGLVGPCMAIDPEGGGLSDHRLPQLEPIDEDPHHVDRHRQGFRKLGQAREREWLWRLGRRRRGRQAVKGDALRAHRGDLDLQAQEGRGHEVEAGAIDLQPMALRIAQAHPVDPHVEGQEAFDAGDLRGLALARERPARERGDLALAPPRLQHAESTGEGGEDQEDERQAASIRARGRPAERA